MQLVFLFKLYDIIHKWWITTMNSQNVLLSSALDTNPSSLEIPSLAPPLPSQVSSLPYHSNLPPVHPVEVNKLHDSVPKNDGVPVDVQPSECNPLSFSVTTSSDQQSSSYNATFTNSSAFYTNSLLQFSSSYPPPYVPTPTQGPAIHPDYDQSVNESTGLQMTTTSLPMEDIENTTFIMAEPLVSSASHSTETYDKGKEAEHKTLCSEHISQTFQSPFQTPSLDAPVNPLTDEFSNQTNESCTADTVDVVTSAPPSEDALLAESSLVSPPSDTITSSEEFSQAIVTSSTSISTSNPVSNSMMHPRSLTLSIPYPSTEATPSSPREADGSSSTFQRPVLCYTRILLGEITPLLSAMRQSTPRWSHHHGVSMRFWNALTDNLYCKQ